MSGSFDVVDLTCESDDDTVKNREEVRREESNVKCGSESPANDRSSSCHQVVQFPKCIFILGLLVNPNDSSRNRLNYSWTGKHILPGSEQQVLTIHRAFSLSEFSYALAEINHAGGREGFLINCQSTLRVQNPFDESNSRQRIDGVAEVDDSDGERPIPFPSRRRRKKVKLRVVRVKQLGEQRTKMRHKRRRLSSSSCSRKNSRGLPLVSEDLGKDPGKSSVVLHDGHSAVRKMADYERPLVIDETMRDSESIAPADCSSTVGSDTAKEPKTHCNGSVVLSDPNNLPDRLTDREHSSVIDDNALPSGSDDTQPDISAECPTSDNCDSGSELGQLPRSFLCGYCEFTATNEELYHLHIASHFPGSKPYPRVYCPNCPYSSGHEKYLLFHMRKKHNISSLLFYRSGEKGYICHLCRKTRDLKTDMEAHVQSHNRKARKK